ncbi:MAG: hypothetical protein ACOC0L_01435 [bacterium]
MTTDADILRPLVEQYLEICARPEQAERRRLWRKLHDLDSERPMVYVRAFAWKELPENVCECRDSLFRQQEQFLRKSLLKSSFGDDMVFEPWLVMQAAHRARGWGVDIPRHTSDEARGSFKVDYPLKSLDDVDKLRTPRHDIDEEKSAENLERLQEAVGDLIPISLDRRPAWRVWSADISTDLFYLRGMENFMIDMLDNPEGLHRLAKFMSDGILKAHDEAEAAGDWSEPGGELIQGMPYGGGVREPAPNKQGVPRKELWWFAAAQEFTAVSPQMHEEFLLRYQLPILEKFGAVAYGCCEDLSRKIDMLRAIPNLRRIAVSPFADVPACAEQIGTDYVISYRPSPADMVSYDWNPDRVRSILRRDLESCRGCHMDIVLKDVETVQGDSQRLRRWVETVREVIE